MSNQVVDKEAAASGEVPEQVELSPIAGPVALPNWIKDDLKDVTLYQMAISPPCVKVRTILQYHGVPFKVINGKKKGDAY